MTIPSKCLFSSRLTHVVQNCLRLLEKKKAGMPIDPGEINHELLGTLLSVPMHGWLVI